MTRRVFSTLIVILLVGLAITGVAQAMPSNTRGEQTLVSAQSSAAYCATAEELALLDLINDYRAAKGLAPLSLVVPLGAAARHHAESMATFDYFDFTLIPENVTFDQNIRMFGYEGGYVGANIAAGPASITAAVVFDQWLNSPSQNANLLNPLFAAIGIGSSSNPSAALVDYWAAAFGDDANVEIAAGCGTAPVVPTATQTPSPSPTETPSPKPTSTPTPESTVATPGTTPTVPPTATLTATPKPTNTASAPTPSATATNPVPSVASPSAATTVVAGVACASSRDVARAGQDVVVSCAGFGPEENLELFWDQALESAKLDDEKTDAGGSVQFTFSALEVPSRSYIIIVRSVKTRLTATTPIEIRPGLFPVPRSGDPGDVISADLTGFQPGETVTILWFDNLTTSRVLRQVTVGEDGSWTTTFRAPASDPGTHEIRANGLSGGTATANFEIESN